jgi:ATP-dependent Clp protease ATP-binding subunit ClpC
MVEEPSRAEAMTILRGLKPGLERHHHMQIRDEALQEALRLSVRYLPDLYLPDKAIDLLDEGAAHARMEELQQHRGSSRQDMEEALQTAVRESRFEKAAELRDKMQKMVQRAGESRRPRTVTAQDIAWAVSARTGIPVGRLTSGERERLLNLEGLLEQRVMGQPARGGRLLLQGLHDFGNIVLRAPDAAHQGIDFILRQNSIHRLLLLSDY